MQDAPTGDVMARLNAVMFEQQPGAPKMYVTAASADSILGWADAPRSSVDLMALYQRALDPKRAPELTKFIESDPMNIIPGSVVIAVRAEAMTVTPQTSPRADSPGTPCRIQIAAELKDRNGALTTAVADLRKRMDSGELSAVSGYAVNPDAESSDLEEAEIEETVEDDSGIPHSYLTLMPQS